MDLVFSRQTTMVNWDGVAVQLKRDEPWHKSDPFVQAKPEFFADEPSRIQGTRGSLAIPGSVPPRPGTPKRDVEDGRQAPGTKRTGKSRG